MSSTRKTRIQRTLFVVAFCLVVAVTILGSMKASRLSDERLDQVIGKATATTLPTDGRLMLGRDERTLSLDAIAYVTGDPAQSVLFPKWRGKGTQIVGELWSSTALKVGQDVHILMPRTPAPDEPSATARIAPTTMQSVRVTKQRKDHWYTVERSEN